MTSPTTLEGPIAALREREIQLLNDIAEALQDEGDEAAADRKRLRDVAQDLHDMFFMVGVIGEFNSGKSTLVNAMLGERLLPTGITPTTEYIELIRYNQQPNKVPTVREDGLREWAHPNTGAEGVAIVDTPGTGSVFERHEKTAKEFLHRSDLVVFVISAKQAFAETERKYIEMAQRFGKKIILVVNQVDLLQQNERAEVRRFIEEQVKEKLGIEPLIFMVSAKEALKAVDEGTTTADAGGMDAVKAHLRGVYSSAPPARQKLLAQLATAEGCINVFISAAKKKTDLVSTDISKVREVQAELEQQSLGLEAQMREAGNRIKSVLESVRKRGLDWIETNFSPRLLGQGANREKMQADFQEVVIGRSLRDINESTNDYINAVIDQSRLYWRSVIDRLNQIQDLMDQEMSALDSNVYAEQRKSLQEAIAIAEGELKSYSTGTVVNEMEQIFKANLSSFQGQALFTAGGLAVVALAILTPGPLIGGTAVLAFPAFLVGAAVATVAGVPAYRTYRKMRRETKERFNERVDLLIKSYDESLSELTQKERNRLTQYGNQILTPIFSRLEVLSKRYADQRERLERYTREIEDLRGRIEAL